MSKRVFWLLGTVLCSAVSVNAATLTVTGTITPDACTINLGRNGNIDLGNTSREVVRNFAQEGPFYLPPETSFPLTVSCGGPTGVALIWTDNKADSLTPDDIWDMYRYGMGKHEGNNIGRFEMEHSDLKVAVAPTDTPTAPLEYLSRPAGSTAPFGPAAGPSGGRHFFNKNEQLTVRLSGTGPTPISLITGTIKVRVHYFRDLINSATSAINLDGSATVNLAYI